MASPSRARTSAPAARHSGAKIPALAASLYLLLAPLASAALSLSRSDAERIGRQIWQNECGGTVAGLTSWNTGESFASLGIGHFIWYPAGKRGPFEESFPQFVHYAAKRGAKLPDILLGRKSGACPWDSRAEFLAAQSSTQMKQLRIFLKDTIDFQADFLVERLREALPKMLAAVPASDRARVEAQFQRVASSPQGCYALVDFVNFKGEGTLATERYQGRGWGLLQVLEGIFGQGDGRAAAREFADSAARVLRQRVENSPPARNEERWLPGWLNRVATYR